MVSPAWFYSTIAQASAALIGLTIAFTLSTHLSRRERRQRKTDRVRKEVIELKKKYSPLLDTISQILKESGGFETPSVRYELEDVSEAQEWAETQEDPVKAKVWALVSGVSHILSDFTLLDSEISREQQSVIMESVHELEYSVFYRNNGSDKVLYEELTGNEPEEADGHYYFDNILEDHGRIGAWLNRNRTAREENMIATTPDDLTGQNLFSLATLFEMFDNDLTELGVESTETDATADFLTVNLAQNVMITSMKLSLWGVFLPTLLLISSPELGLPNFISSEIPKWVSNYEWVVHLIELLIQIAIFVISSFYALRLFVIMLMDMRTTVPTMGDILSEPEQNNGEDGENDTEDLGRKSRLIRLLLRKSIPDNIGIRQ